MEVINNIIGVPLGYIMWLCYTLIQNYGIAILAFTLLTKALMFPLNIWIQKNSIKMIKDMGDLHNLDPHRYEKLNVYTKLTGRITFKDYEILIENYE